MKCFFLILAFACFNLAAQSPLDQAKSLFEAKKYDDARRLLNTIPEGNKNYAASRYYLGRIAFNEEKYEESMDFLEEAVDADDKVADYHYWYASAMGNVARDANMLRQGLLAPEIKTEFEKTVKLDPTNQNAYWGLITYYTEAPGIMGGSFEKALETAGAIKKLSEADGHRALGLVYTKQEKFTEAEKEYLEAYRVNPLYTNPIINFYIGRKQYDKAFGFLEDALKREPENMLLIYQIGRGSALTGLKLDRGEECLKKYLAYQPKENEPRHAGAQMRLGQILEKKGNKDEAKKLYQAAVKQDPSLKEATEGLERLSK